MPRQLQTNSMTAPQAQQGGGKGAGIQNLLSLGQMAYGLANGADPFSALGGMGVGSPMAHEANHQPQMTSPENEMSMNISEKFQKEQDAMSQGMIAPEQTVEAQQADLNNQIFSPGSPVGAGLNPAEAATLLWAMNGNGRQVPAMLQQMFGPAPVDQTLRPFSPEANYMSLPGYYRWKGRYE